MNANSFPPNKSLSFSQFALSAVLALVSFTAYATPVLWNINNIIFDDGGTGSGSFIYDEDTDSFSAISITTTAGTLISGYTYTVFHPLAINPPGPAEDIRLVSLSGVPAAPIDSRLTLEFSAPLTNAGGVITFLSTSGESLCSDHIFCADRTDPTRLIISGSMQPGDSDGDGLADTDEIALGTDPGVTDTDGDGIPDGSDPDIIATAVTALPLGVFSNRGDPAGQRNAMLSILIDIQSDIASGDIEQALRALRNLRRRVDGCGTSADSNDWINDCVSQFQIRRLIDLLITNLGG